MRFLDFAGKYVIADRICAIEHGDWSNDAQDWYATLVCIGGTRIVTDLLVQNAKALIESAQPQPEKSP